MRIPLPYPEVCLHRPPTLLSLDDLASHTTGRRDTALQRLSVAAPYPYCGASACQKEAGREGGLGVPIAVEASVQGEK